MEAAWEKARTEALASTPGQAKQILQPALLAFERAASPEVYLLGVLDYAEAVFAKGQYALASEYGYDLVLRAFDRVVEMTNELFVVKVCYRFSFVA
jgi:hypothetical protein